METVEADISNRKNLRVPILVTRVKGEIGGKSNIFFGYAKNVSRAGLFIQTINPKDEHEKYNIEFTLPDFEEPIECTAEVVWKRPYLQNADYEPGMGLKFLDLNEKKAELIDRWVNMNKKRG